jgi:hypothetical protein
MMRKLATEHNVASPQELLDLAREMGVRLIPCFMTMELLGLSREDLIEGLEVGGGGHGTRRGPGHHHPVHLTCAADRASREGARHADHR